MWVAGATVAVGVGSAVSASNSASKDRKAAAKSDKASLAFEQQKYDDWQEVYGPIEKNLSKFYNSMTPESLATQNLTEFNRQNATAIETINTTLAQRGMLNSGTSAAVTLASELNSAEKRADIRATADEQVAAEQGRFLQIGLGQNPGDSMSQVLQNKALRDADQASYSSQVAGKAVNTALTSAGSALDDYVNRPKTPQTPQPVTTINTGAGYGNIS